MPIGAAIGAGAAIGGATTLVAGSKAAKAQKQGAETAAAAQLDAARIATDENRRQYDTTRTDYAPGRIVGEQALYKLADMYGVARPTEGIATRSVGSGVGAPANDTGMGLLALYGGGAAPSAPVSLTAGYGGFEASPGYQFRKDEATKAIERSAASRGLLGSGATQKALGRFVDGFASSEYDSYANRLAALAGVGQTATAGTAAAGQAATAGITGAATAAGQGVAQGALNAGNARASSYANTGSAINSTINNLTSAYLYSQQPKYVMPGVGG